MKNNVIALIAGLGLSSGAVACPEFLDAEMRKLSSKETINFCESYAGKPMLIVNTASNCGYTPQFSGLESLHQEYKDKGLVVVGFSSDDFFQEENDEADAATVCFEKYDVSFPVMATTSVRGRDANLSSRVWEKHRVTRVGTSTSTWSQQRVKWLLNLDRV